MIGKAVLASLAFTLVAVPLLADEPSSCIRCHTDEAALESLFVPPRTPAGEGEG